MTRDLLVSPDRKGSDGVARFGADGCLAGKLFEDFGGSGESIAGFAYAYVWALAKCRVGTSCGWSFETLEDPDGKGEAFCEWRRTSPATGSRLGTISSSRPFPLAHTPRRELRKLPS